FSVLSPLIGPAIDRLRGGRRAVAMLSAAVRALVCFLMIRHVDSLLLFPEAFAVLVCSKAYAVSKSALVPTVVRDQEELVEANSKLALISGVIAFVFGAPAAGLGALLGPEPVLALAAVV